MHGCWALRFSQVIGHMAATLPQHDAETFSRCALPPPRDAPWGMERDESEAYGDARKVGRGYGGRWVGGWVDSARVRGVV